MSNISVETSSVEVLTVPLLTNVDPGNVTVEIAFEDLHFLSAAPTWYPATVDSSGDFVTLTYNALLSPGTYYWFIRITEPTGVPVERGRNRLIVY